MAAVLGIAEHSGWAEFVAVGLQGGAPVLLERQRVALVAADVPHNPYHHEGLVLPLAASEALIARVRQSVVEHTRAALAAVRDRHGLTAAVLRESPHPPLPQAAEVLKNYTLTCAADGMMYRETLADEAAALGLEVVRHPRKADPLALAAEALGVERKTVDALVGAFGKTVGPPWRKEHRLAAAAALWVLARSHTVRV